MLETRAVRPLRMGITTACGLALEKTALGVLISLDLLIAKQDNLAHGKKEKPERAGAWQSRRKGTSRKPVRCRNHQDCQQGRERKSRKAIRSTAQPDSEIGRCSP
jgi:hypothetical protein